MSEDKEEIEDSSFNLGYDAGFDDGVNYQKEKQTASIRLDTGKPVNLGVTNGIDPCPLCGGKEGDDVFLGYKEPRYMITCVPCSLRIIDDRKDKVQGKWNTRNGKDHWDKLAEERSTASIIQQTLEYVAENVGNREGILNMAPDIIKLIKQDENGPGEKQNNKQDHFYG